MIEVWTDGAMRPFKITNKKNDTVGHSSIGVIVKKDGKTIHTISKYVGILDSNQAEYEAFIEGIQFVLDLEATYVKFYSDSDLLVNQMNDKYGAYSEIIIPYYMKAKRLLQLIPCYEIKWIPREENKETDVLTKLALDKVIESLDS